MGQDVQKKADKVISWHKIDFDHFYILDSENNEQKRKFSEILFIKKYENKTINLKTDINLYSKYSHNERF